MVQKKEYNIKKEIIAREDEKERLEKQIKILEYQIGQLYTAKAILEGCAD